MLKNYLKIAWKVLLRRKLFTFISLFGISFTVMVLVIVTAQADSLTAPITPEVNLDRCLFIKKIEVWHSDAGLSRANPPYFFLDKYVRKLTTPQNVSIYTAGSDYEGRNENGETEFHVKYTDAAFWEILKFDFLEGSSFSKRDVDNARNIAVISESTKERYYGTENSVGKKLTIKGNDYRIVGVVKDINKSRTVYADVWIPISASRADLKSAYAYSYEAMILAPGKSDFPKIKDEFYSSLKTVDTWDGGLKRIICPVKTNSEWLEGGKILGIQLFENPYQSLEKEQWISFAATIIAFMCFFIVLPVLNLISLNTARVFERSSEISVRKAFGASSLTLTGQFITENLFLTLLGGTIGLIAAFAAIYLLNSSVYFDANITINYRVICYAFLLNITLGLLSGAYPAYKMSKLDPAAGLRRYVK